MGVRKLKSNKTTCPSRVGADHLTFLELPCGVHVLPVMLNFIFRAPELANTELASGWVFLVPKKARVDDAAHFRPIVCGEVFSSNLPPAWPLLDWLPHDVCLPPVLALSLGMVFQKHCLYILRHSTQTSALFAGDTLFVQPDLSQAFDSLQRNALLKFFVQNWSGLSAKSASLLRWGLLQSHLRFEIFDTVWWCFQKRGTQQGKTHSPTLFSRVVAARFDTLAREWCARGELPAFTAGPFSLWGIWFMDDAILFPTSLCGVLVFRFAPAAASASARPSTTHTTTHDTASHPTPHTALSSLSHQLITQHSSHTTHGARVSAAGPRLACVWQAQYTQSLLEELVRAWAPRAAAGFGVASAVHGAFWRSWCAWAPLGRWLSWGRRSLESFLEELVHAWAPLGRGWLSCGRRSTQSVGAAGPRLAFVCQARYTVPSGGAAPFWRSSWLSCGRRSLESLKDLEELVTHGWAPLGRGWLSCGRRSAQSLLEELVRAWAPLGRGWLSCGRRST